MKMLLGKYNGTEIEARPIDQYVNATAMCKATGKKWPDYNRLDQTRQFIVELSSFMGIPMKELVVTKRGNHQQGGGTWVHPDIAIHLAQWCSPKFAVWVSQQIRRIVEGHPVAHQEVAELTLQQSFEAWAGQLTGQVKDNAEDIDTLFAINSRMNVKRRSNAESEVRDRHAVRLNGQTEVRVSTGDSMDIYVPGQFVVEVKREDKWKDAIGQVITYQRRHDPRASKLIILFTAPGSKPYLKCKRRQIARDLNNEGIEVHWDGDDEQYNFEPSKQAMLF